MKKLFYILPLVCLMFACKKESSTPEEEQITPIAGKSNTVFFVDTFRVYATDLAGNNKKLILDEDVKSGNNYIMNIDFATSKKLVYTYKPETNTKQEIRIINADGTDKKTIKTLASTTTSFDFIASFGNKILYTTLDYNGTSPVLDIRWMDENGANDAKVNWPKPTIAARDGSGYLSINSNYGITVPTHNIYRVKIVNGVFAETNSFNVPTITGVIRGSALSSDGNTFIYLLAPTYTSDKYDVMSLDLSKKDGATKKIMTYELPKTGDGALSYPQNVKLTFANGTANVIISYGVQVSTNRYATKDDYYFFQSIDVEKATLANKWKIFNEYGGSHIVD
ncbi:MAG: hypothetical protein EOP00_03990 [Pedobacter sp.]|nr:MAG: hypothetical protein EOP00_03990 [Pedobacter sp.]